MREENIGWSVNNIFTRINQEKEGIICLDQSHHNQCRFQESSSPVHNIPVSCPFPIHGQDHSAKRRDSIAVLPQCKEIFI